MKLQRAVLTVGWLIGAVLLFVGAVEAHAGGQMRVASQDAGPFKMTVWTSPDPARVGQIHVAAAVASAEDALPVVDAEVFIELTLVNDAGEPIGEPVGGPASRQESANQFLYETIFDIPDEGLYHVRVVALRGLEGAGEVAFDMEVASGPPLALGILGIVVLGVMTGGAVWFYLRLTSAPVEPVELEELEEEADEFDAVPD